MFIRRVAVAFTFVKALQVRVLHVDNNPNVAKSKYGIHFILCLLTFISERLEHIFYAPRSLIGKARG